MARDPLNLQDNARAYNELPEGVVRPAEPVAKPVDIKQSVRTEAERAKSLEPAAAPDAAAPAAEEEKKSKKSKSE